MIFRFDMKSNYIFVTLVLSFASLTPPSSSLETAEALLPQRVCQYGFLQQSPIILGCEGSNHRINFSLEGAGRPHHIMFWQAPAGTQHLSATARLHPAHGGHGRASLGVACADTGQVLIGDDDGILNRHNWHTTMHGAHWQWGSDNKSDYGERFEEWFRVDGSLPCDIIVTLKNDDATVLFGTFQYEWAGIRHCPEVLLGCRRCTEETGGCMDRGMIAVCDGSPNVTCKTAAALKAEQALRQTGPSTPSLGTTTSALVSSSLPATQGSYSVTTLHVHHTTTMGSGMRISRPNSSPFLQPGDATDSTTVGISIILPLIVSGIVCFCICMYVRRSRQTSVLLSGSASLHERDRSADSRRQSRRSHNAAPFLSGVEKSDGPGGYEPVRSDDAMSSASDTSPVDIIPWDNDGL